MSAKNLKTKGAIHSTKISGNFGPTLNRSVRSNRKSFEKTVGRSGWNFGWKGRALRFIAHACNERFKMAASKGNTGSREGLYCRNL